MDHIEIGKAVLAAGLKLEAEFVGGARMRVSHYDDADGRVVGQLVAGTLDQIYEDRMSASPSSLIVAYKIIL